MFLRGILELVGMVTLVVTTARLAELRAQESLHSDRQAHLHAETVLYPDFVSKMNAWLLGHAVGDPEHLRTFDAKDAKRFKAAREAWHKFEEEMKLAGFK